MTTLSLQDVVVAGVAGAAARLRVPALALQPGLTVLVGENGAGKSTLLDVAAGLVRPTSGRVTLDGAPLSSWPAPARAARIASIGQADALDDDDETVAERIARGLAPRRGAFALFDDVAAAAVGAAAAAVGLDGHLHRGVAQLSGGERRRASIARALVDVAASAVLLDEPFAGLDVTATACVVDALRARAARGAVVVVSVHDVATALALGGRLLGLRAGGIVVDGPLPEALSGAAVVWGDVRVVAEDGWVGVLRRAPSST
jgi:iron complex transport system ATP-binding protein